MLMNCTLPPQLQSLVVDIGALAEGYHIPGQFVQIKVGDSKAGFYAIASPPDPNNQGCIELLIKSVPGTTSELLAASTAGGRSPKLQYYYVA